MLDFPNSPTTNQVYVALNNTSWIWDGVKWSAGGPVPITGGPFLPLSGGTMTGPLNWTSTGATQSRAAQDRSAEVYDVKDYGAKGDGTTDDRAAVQAAFTAASAGGEVWFPPGNYISSGVVSLSPTGNIVIRGAGIGVSTLSCASNGISLSMQANSRTTIDSLTIAYTGAGTANTGLALLSPDQSALVWLKNLALRGNIGNTTGWQTGISMTNIGTPVLDSILIYMPNGTGNPGPTGIYYTGSPNVYATGFRMSNSLIVGGQYGLRIGDWVQGVCCVGCDIIGNDYGVYWSVPGTTAADVWLGITNCHFNCSRRNIYGNSILEVGVVNCLFYRFAPITGVTNWAAIELVTTTHITINGNQVNGTGNDTEAGFIITDATGTATVITGNAIERLYGNGITLSGNTAGATVVGNVGTNLFFGGLINDTTGNTSNQTVGNISNGVADVNYHISSGTFTVNGISTGAGVALNGPAATNRLINFSSNNVTRWFMGVDSSAESGANAGSNFQIISAADSGALTQTPLSIARNSGVVNFSATPTVAGAAMPFLPLSGGTVSGATGLAGGLTINTTNSSGWSADIFGRQLILQSGNSNPGLGIADNTGANYIGMFNWGSAGGYFVFAGMPPLNDTTTTPDLRLTLSSTAATIYKPLTVPDITLNDATSPLILFPAHGNQGPAFSTRSLGTKLVIYPALSGTTVDYAIGFMNNNAMWFSVPTSASGAYYFTWWGGNSQIAYMDGAGALNVQTSYSVNANQVVGARIAGYGTPTGNSKLASFPGASATLAQCSAQIAQLIVDLKTHGLLGA